LAIVSDRSNFPAPSTAPRSPLVAGSYQPRWRRSGGAALFAGLAAVTLLFAEPLYRLINYALEEDLHSHALIVPFVVGYLVWWGRATRPPRASPDRLAAAVFTAAALGLLLARHATSIRWTEEGGLALTTLAYVLLLWAVCAWFLGRPAMKSLVFPLALLLFLPPLPPGTRQVLEAGLQQPSALMALLAFKVAAIPVLYDNLSFQLPGVRLAVAPECSGLHSTLALFLCSLLAGHVFLRAPSLRGLLAAAVLPLGILRNGARIFIVGDLCVRHGPDMIDSWIHRHGGPLFFAASLLPLVGLLYLLVRYERRSRAASTAPALFSP
jgi:exosortase C (VPDSG-CTERM-specific)